MKMVMPLVFPSERQILPALFCTQGKFSNCFSPQYRHYVFKFNEFNVYMGKSEEQ